MARLFSRKARTSTRKSTVRRHLLRGLEHLEGRRLMAGIELLGSTLRLSGDAGDNAAEIAFENDRVTATIQTGSEQIARNFPRESVSQIEFIGGAGNDAVTNRTSLPMSAWGEAGNDVLSGGSGND
ncbi:MAG: hypothetical protein KDA38_14465, partial [Planctomycetales bacterium]|nr:hypothetical protein [Planctomycetales bacterium]